MTAERVNLRLNIRLIPGQGTVFGAMLGQPSKPRFKPINHQFVVQLRPRAVPLYGLDSTGASGGPARGQSMNAFG